MTRGIHWFRSDLRLRDNRALAEIAGCVDELVAVFVIDPALVSPETIDRPRTLFLFDCLERLGADLHRRGIPLLIRRGPAAEVIPGLVEETGASVLSFGTGSTPFATRRDTRVREALETQGVRVLEHRDNVVFAGGAIQTKTGRPYQVYTPYRNAWWQHWDANASMPVAAPRLPAPIPGYEKDRAPTLSRPERSGSPFKLPTGGERAAHRRLDAFLDRTVERYAEDRDRPDRDGTSRLSPYLRFGVLSPRDCFMKALEARSLDPKRDSGITKWLDELIWREFYTDLALAKPQILSGNARPEYDRLVWENDPEHFAAWAEGRTGYPIVDAGMRQLRRTGWMHNRVRMIVASFLTKDLLIDWRHGERLFMELLVDGDPTSNNGGWQWAASTGSDAQPYFRIFNPVTQGRRYDPDGRYVREWVPELRSLPNDQIHAPWLSPRARAGATPKNNAGAYPAPIVDHAERRKLALDRYKKARALGELK
jgi:deoxyribodipyrimidine photo-lyase